MFIACESDKEDIDTTPEPPVETATVKVDPETLDFVQSGAETQQVAVTASDIGWIATVDEEGKEWCEASVLSVGGARTIFVSVTDNPSKEARSTKIYVTLEEAADTVTVNQLGQEPSIAVRQSLYVLTPDAQGLTLDVTANVEYTLESDVEWIQWIEDRSTPQSQVFLVEENLNTSSRSGKITLTEKGGGVETEVTVTQQPGEPEEERVSDTPDLLVPIASISTRATAELAHETALIRDNRLKTFWRNEPETAPFDITFAFAGGVPQIDFLVYYPPQGEGGLGEVDLYWRAVGGTETFLMTHDFGMKQTPDTLYFPTALENPSSVRFSVKSAAETPGQEGIVASIAEMEFFQAYVAPEFEEFFTDFSCSELKPGVTKAQASRIADTMWRRVAMEMADGTYQWEFRTGSYKAYRHPDSDAADYSTNKYTLFDNVTGMMIPEPGTYTICIDEIPSGVTVSACVVDYRNDEYVTGKNYPLLQGIRQYNITNSGILYIKYHSEQYASLPPIKVHFPDATVNGYFDPKKHDPSLFQPMLLNAKAGYFELIGRRSLLCMPVTNLRTSTRTGDNAVKLINLTDSIVALEEQLQGHWKYNTGGHHNRMLFRATYGSSYMYSTAYSTAYNANNNAISIICNPTSLLNNLWGPAHEVGHSNQISRGLKWAGTTEVTNNICSAYVQFTLTGGLDNGGYTAFYNHSESSTYNNHYNMGLRDVVLGKRAHFWAGSFDELYYVKAVPFWQLHLYYTYVKNNPDFYPDVYNAVRNRTDNATIDEGVAQLEFVKTCSDAVQEDLTDFFEDWGFLTVIPAGEYYVNDYGRKTMTVTQAQIDEVKTYCSKYPKPDHDIKFIYEGNIDAYRSAAAPVGGTVTVDQSKKFHYQCTDWSGVVAYELRDADGNVLMYSVTPDFKYSTSGMQWTDADGNPSPNNKSTTTYYYTKKVGPTVSFIEDAQVYGITASGERIPAANYVRN